MAEINPSLQTQGVPGFVDNSARGIRTDRSGGVAGLVNNVAKQGFDLFNSLDQAADKRVISDIENEVASRSDAIRSEFGIDAATDFETGIDDSNQPVPTVLQRQGETLSGLTASYRQGKLKSSNYTARLQSMVRQMRSQFPDYRKEIDALVQRETGITPANALVSQLRNEALASSGVSSKLEQEKFKSLSFLRRNGINSYDQNSPIEAIFAAEATVGKINSDMKLRTSELNMLSKQRTVQQDEYKAGLVSVSDNYMKLVTAKSPAIQNLNQAVNNFIKDPNIVLDPSSLSQFSAMINGARQDFNAAFDQVLSGIGPNGESIGVDFRSKITDRDFLDRERANALQPLDVLEKAVKDKDIGALSLAMNSYKFSSQTIAGRVVRNSDGAALISALNLAVPNNRAFAAMISKQPQFTSEILGWATSTEKLKLVTENRSLIDSLGSSLNDAEVHSPQEVGKVYKEVTGLIAETGKFAKNLPDDVIRRISNNFFAPENLAMWDKYPVKQKSRVLLAMSDPDFMKRMWDMRQKGDVTAWNQFQEFYISSFNILNAPNMAQLKQAIEDRPFLDITFDPKNTEMIVRELNPDESVVANESGLRQNIVRATESLTGATAFAGFAARDFNLKLDGLRNIARIQGMDANQEKDFIFGVLQEGRVNPGASKNKPGVLEALDWLGDKLKPFVDRHNKFVSGRSNLGGAEIGGVPVRTRDEDEAVQETLAAIGTADGRNNERDVSALNNYASSIGLTNEDFEEMDMRELSRVGKLLELKEVVQLVNGVVIPPADDDTFMEEVKARALKKFTDEGDQAKIDAIFKEIGNLD